MGQFVYRHSGVRRISLRNEEFDKVGWLVFNVQRAIFQLYSGREHLKI